MVLMCVAGAMAQAPKSFTYQAVVRNDSNNLVTNANVGVRIAIQDEAGNELYSESHLPKTNENGLITLEIGNGDNQVGSLNNLNWGGAAYFLRTEVDPKGGQSYSMTILQRLSSVPYALYADEAGNVFSGNYNDLSNRPELFSGNYNDLTNRPNLAAVATSGSYADLLNRPNLATVATTGSYTDLSNTPNLATVATTGNYGDLNGTPNLATVATTGSYTDLSSTPTIPTFPTQVSAFSNDAGYLTLAQVTNMLAALYQRIDSLQQFIADNITCCSSASPVFPAAVGDILCTDGSWVSPELYAVSGKTALGVIFHVDESGQHGWAVHLNDQSTSIMWGGYGTDIPSLPNVTNASGAATDTAGYSNTQIIRAYGAATTYPAAWAVDFDNGWYLPAAGQLNTLYGVMSTVNASLQTAGGTEFGGSGTWYYWSSTEYSSSSSWYLSNDGSLYDDNKVHTLRVRSVRAF